jgi:adenylate kinase
VNITVFLGAPGSGKGTQAKRLAETHSFTHFSTGDMLRAAIRAGSQVGLAAKVYIDRGELVPDNVMIELIANALKPLSGNAKIVLDGFPRTVPQAEALDRDALTQVGKAIFFTIPEPELVRRLTGRRVCEKCGEPYHVVYLTPKVDGICDRCSGKLIQRVDDAEDVVRRRLAIFSEQNGELLTYYRLKGKLLELDADRQVDLVQANLVKLLNQNGSN